LSDGGWSRRRPVVWVLAFAGAAGLAFATTEFEMGVPAGALGMLALGVVVLAAVVGGVFLERLTGTARAVGLSILLLGLGVVAAQAYLRPGVPWGHDITHHAWALWSLWRCVLEGDWLPRWNPYLSLGVPLLQFYAPLPYMLAWPAQALGASPAGALAWLMVLGQTGTALSAYLCVRWCRGSVGAGLLAAMAVCFAPYHSMDQTFRVALGETMAFPFIAPALVAAWKLARGERDRAATWVLGACAVALLLTHILTLFMVVTVGAGLVVGGLVGRRESSSRGRRATLGVLALTTALAVGACAAWWLPVATEVEHTAVSQISKPGAAISPFAALADEPVRRRLWPRYDVRRRIGKVKEPGLGMPMYFGCGLLALLLLGLVAPRDQQLPSPRPWAIAGAVVLVLALWPAAKLLDGLPIIGRIMFPWRLYAPATVLAALAGGLAFDVWSAGRGVRGRLALLAVVAGVLAWDGSPYLGAATQVSEHDGAGVFAFRGDRVLPVQGIPRDRWVRIEDARLPPSDYDWNLALGRRAFPEYMSRKLRRRYGLHSKPPSVETSEFYGASFRVRRGKARPVLLSPEPMVSYRPDGEEWRGLADAEFVIRPEHISITAAQPLQAGRVRFSMAWFPGWEVSVDGGEWSAAPMSSSLLAVRIPERTRSIEFRYSALRPWGRAAGLLLSGLTLLGLGVLASHQLRRGQPRDDHRPEA
jgi:hypothetical protein